MISVFMRLSFDKKNPRVNSFVISIIAGLVAELITSGIIAIFYSISRTMDEWKQQDIAIEKNVTDNTAKMKKYFGISDISHDDNYRVVMLSYVNTDTHNLNSSDKELVRIYQEDNKNSTDISGM